MTKRELLLPVFFVAVIAVTGLGSCEIIFNQQFEEVYSYGDKVTFSFSIEKESASLGYVQLNVLCNSTDFLVYNEHTILEDIFHIMVIAAVGKDQPADIRVTGSIDIINYPVFLPAYSPDDLFCGIFPHKKVCTWY